MKKAQLEIDLHHKPIIDFSKKQIVRDIHSGDVLGVLGKNNEDDSLFKAIILYSKNSDHILITVPTYQKSRVQPMPTNRCRITFEW